MGLTRDVLKLLKKHREQYLSAQEIATQLSSSRTAVLKAIHQL